MSDTMTPFEVVENALQRVKTQEHEVEQAKAALQAAERELTNRRNTLTAARAKFFEAYPELAGGA